MNFINFSHIVFLNLSLYCVSLQLNEAFLYGSQLEAGYTNFGEFFDDGTLLEGVESDLDDVKVGFFFILRKVGNQVFLEAFSVNSMKTELHHNIFLNFHLSCDYELAADLCLENLLSYLIEEFLGNVYHSSILHMLSYFVEKLTFNKAWEKLLNVHLVFLILQYLFKTM